MDDGAASASSSSMRRAYRLALVMMCNANAPSTISMAPAMASDQWTGDDLAVRNPPRTNATPVAMATDTNAGGVVVVVVLGSVINTYRRVPPARQGSLCGLRCD